MNGPDWVFLTGSGMLKLSEFGRCADVDLFEIPVEIGKIAEPYLIADLRDTEAVLLQKFAGLACPDLI